MKQQEIVEGNRLIAFFMGAKLGNPLHKIEVLINIPNWHGTTDTEATKDLQYHRRWDWLMPVVEKIEYEHGRLLRIEGFVCQATASSNENPCLPPFDIKRHTNKKIDSVWQVVIEFIKWYNEQSKTPNP